jgi:hypothetical protein
MASWSDSSEIPFPGVAEKGVEDCRRTTSSLFHLEQEIEGLAGESGGVIPSEPEMEAMGFLPTRLVCISALWREAVL